MKDKIHKCCECGYKLTQYEISDNLYVGVQEINYICYSCQSLMDQADEEDDNHNFDEGFNNYPF